MEKKQTKIEYILEKIDDAILSFEEMGLEEYHRNDQSKMLEIKKEIQKEYSQG